MKISRFISLFLSMLICIAVICTSTASVFATETVDLDRKCSMELTYEDDGTLLKGVNVKIYRVADVSEYLQFSFATDYTDCGVSLNTLDNASDWSLAAQTIESYIVSKKIDAVANNQSDANGKVTANNLSVGLYLIAADNLTINNTVYSFPPQLLSIPNKDDNDSNLDYDVKIVPKFSTSTITDKDVDFTLVKKWIDAGYESKRPNSIKASIFKNNELVETVALSSSNNWTYTWKAKDDGAKWAVYENEVDGKYVVSVSSNATNFELTNTIVKTGGSTNLPQTGMLLWPILLLAGGGMAVFTIGFILSNGKNKNEK